MSFLCKIGIHMWQGCKCTVCAKKRDKGHTWGGCKCPKCGKTRDEEHDWSKDCRKCSTCGKERKEAHEWSGLSCVRCGLVSNPRENLARWIAHGDPARWVDIRSGRWNNSMWLNLLESLRRSEFWIMEESDVGRTIEMEKKKWQCGQSGHKWRKCGLGSKCNECGAGEFPDWQDWLIANYGDIMPKKADELSKLKDMMSEGREISAALFRELNSLPPKMVHDVSDFLLNSGFTQRAEMRRCYDEEKTQFLFS